MLENKIDQVPEINEKKKIINLHIRDQIKNIKENLFIIMAGGFGKRLKPYTQQNSKAITKSKKIIKYTLDQAIKNNFQTF